MILSRVHPGPVEPFELDAATTRDRLLELYRLDTPTSLRLNFVASVTGSAAGSDGTSETLTSASDRRILGVIRELSDVVLVGAASVRAEGYQLPRRSRLAVVTTSGDLGGHQLSQDDSQRVIVVCPASATAKVHETLPGAEILTVVSVGGRLSMEDLIDSLRGAGFASIVCEGGPALASQLLSAGLVDELCLTTSPQLGGPALPLLAETVPRRDLTLRQLITDEAGYVFARWSLTVR